MLMAPREDLKGILRIAEKYTVTSQTHFGLCTTSAGLMSHQLLVNTGERSAPCTRNSSHLHNIYYT